MPFSAGALMTFALLMAALTTYITHERDVNNRDNLFYQIAVFVVTSMLYATLLSIESMLVSIRDVIAPEVNEK